MKIKIKEMPSKELLEKFLKGLFSESRVWFDMKKGIFKEEE